MHARLPLPRLDPEHVRETHRDVYYHHHCYYYYYWGTEKWLRCRLSTTDDGCAARLRSSARGFAAADRGGDVSRWHRQNAERETKQSQHGHKKKGSSLQHDISPNFYFIQSPDEVGGVQVGGVNKKNIPFNKQTEACHCNHGKSFTIILKRISKLKH